MSASVLEPETPKVICIRCGTEHEEHPPAREGINKDGLPEFGVWAKDYTYYKDNYLKKGYAVLCNRHDRDVISQTTMKEVIRSYGP